MTSDLVLKALGIPCQVGEKVPVKVDVNGTVYEKTFTLSGYFKGDPISMAQVMAVPKEFQEKAAPQQTESRMKGSGDTGFSAGYYMVDFYFPFSFSLEKQVEAMAELKIIGKFIKFEFSLQNIVFCAKAEEIEWE